MRKIDSQREGANICQVAKHLLRPLILLVKEILGKLRGIFDVLEVFIYDGIYRLELSAGPENTALISHFPNCRNPEHQVDEPRRGILNPPSMRIQHRGPDFRGDKGDSMEIKREKKKKTKPFLDNPG